MSIEIGKQDTILIQYLEKETSSLMEYVQCLPSVTFWKSGLALLYFVVLEICQGTLPSRIHRTWFLTSAGQPAFLRLQCFHTKQQPSHERDGNYKNWLSSWSLLCGKPCRSSVRWLIGGQLGGWEGQKPKPSASLPALYPFVCLFFAKCITRVVSHTW